MSTNEKKGNVPDRLLVVGIFLTRDGKMLTQVSDLTLFDLDLVKVIRQSVENLGSVIDKFVKENQRIISNSTKIIS